MGASGKGFSKEVDEEKPVFSPAFEYYEMRMGCLKFICCRHERTD